jgi:hypothetical protein
MLSANSLPFRYGECQFVTLSGNGDDTMALTQADFRAPGRAPFDGGGSVFLGVFHHWLFADHANNLAAKPTSGQRRINIPAQKAQIRHSTMGRPLPLAE